MFCFVFLSRDAAAVARAARPTERAVGATCRPHVSANRLVSTSVGRCVVCIVGFAARGFRLSVSFLFSRFVGFAFFSRACLTDPHGKGLRYLWRAPRGLLLCA